MKRRADVLEGKEAKRPRSDLCDEQRAVLDAILAHKSVFLTGRAGTGKSRLLETAIGFLDPETTFVTASTGIAATRIGGTTLHSFAGIGLGEGDVKDLLKRMKPDAKQRWRICRVLIVDEISMISAELWDKLEEIARRVRGLPAPFGGIKLVVTGDFAQLPPVRARFAFEATSWNRCFDCTFCLRTIHRQASDAVFCRVLDELRMGRVSETSAMILWECVGRALPAGDIKVSSLFAHRADVWQENERELIRLPRETAHTYRASDTGLVVLLEPMQVPKVLTLRVGAQVMLVKNVDVEGGLSNGSRGVVTSLGPDYAVVLFENGRIVTVTHVVCDVVSGRKVVASRTQIPLILAWALTVHKAQGSTLERARVNLEGSFERGQVYVALSRAKTLAGLSLDAFNPRWVKADDAVVKFYEQFDR